ncbi:MAG: aminotransferase class V-fold PLP-dependent enzyme [Actinomycetales bacterium]
MTDAGGRGPSPAAELERVNDLWGDDWPKVASLWTLEPSVVHLNHGSFGAVPRPIQQEQRSWRERMESNPVRFFAREAAGALEVARGELAAALGFDDASEIGFVRNATTGVGTVLASLARSGRLGADTTLWHTDHAYGAVVIAAQRIGADTGSPVREAPVRLGGGSDEILDALAAVRPNDVVLLDAVTSATAWRLPLAEVVPVLRDRGAVVIVDAAHVPGMTPIAASGVDADFWTGNLHKWACSPRGTAVLHARPEHRALLRPLVASWNDDQGFPRAFDLAGTDDVTAWLAAPAALRLLARLGTDRLRDHNVRLVRQGRDVVSATLQEVSRSARHTRLSPDDRSRPLEDDVATWPDDDAVFMRLVPLPGPLAADQQSASAVQRHLATELGVEVAVTSWRGHGFVRLSAQAYNCPADYVRLAQGLPEAVDTLRSPTPRKHS